jgi:hypothetical protein
LKLDRDRSSLIQIKASPGRAGIRSSGIALRVLAPDRFAPAVLVTIKARKEDGQIINIIAGCGSDIILSNVQFELKVVNEDQVLRLFPGMDGNQLLSLSDVSRSS